jgi:hypothetical protein
MRTPLSLRMTAIHHRQLMGAFFLVIAGRRLPSPYATEGVARPGTRC